METQPQAIVVKEHLPPARQGGGDLYQLSPHQLIGVASEIATALADIVEKQKLFTRVGQGKHVNVEGWTTMGAMLGIVPKENRVECQGGEFIAYVDLISLRTGAVVGGGSATCGASDPTWAKRPLNAQRSMAITRATGKAYRLGYSWIMKLAGYEAAPAEEMDHVATTPVPVSFNAKDRADIDWLKAHPEVDMMDEMDVKKVALEIHGKAKTSAELKSAISRVEAQVKAAARADSANTVQ
jgi:hypothetical protein